MAAAMDPRSNSTSLAAFILCSLCISFYFSVTTASEHKYFSSKTAYALIHSHSQGVIEDELNSVQVGTYSCLAAHASALMRHGTRNPGLGDTKAISRIHDLVKDKLSDNFRDLKEWTNTFPLNNDKTLAKIGEEEQFNLGQRTAKRLKTLFVDEDFENFRFLVSNKQRTQESASAFHEGFTEVLMGGPEEDLDSELSDETLRFHDRCQKYVHSVENNKTALKEYHSFKSGKEMVNVLKKVSSVLNIPEGSLTTDDVRTIYLFCGYETAFFNSSSWCKVFDDEDFKVLEYLQDLKHFYKNGYGYPITASQSCPLITDIFTTMDDAIVAMETEEDEEEEMNGYVLGNFYFGHAETIGPLYAALGLYNDSVPLRADNFEQQGNRKFRTSEILSFSANLMMILYECDQNDELLTESEAADETRETTQYMVSLYVNEKRVKFPGCEDYTCLYRDVRKHYEHLIECNFSKVCDHKNRPKDEL